MTDRYLLTYDELREIATRMFREDCQRIEKEMMRMKRVVIESPFAGLVDRNLRYLRAAMHDCLVHRGEAPYASHGLYTQPGVLDDDIPAERQLGIEAGFAYREVADVSAFYVDFGMSAGMSYGLMHATKNNRPVQYRAFLHGFGEGQASSQLKLEKTPGVIERWSVSSPDVPNVVIVCDSLEEAVASLSRIAGVEKAGTK